MVKNITLLTLSRIIAALFGGYALTQFVSIVIAYLLPTVGSDSVLWAMMLSFIVYTIAVIWAFAAETVKKAWLGLLAPTAILALPVGWIIVYGG